MSDVSQAAVEFGKAFDILRALPGGNDVLGDFCIDICAKAGLVVMTRQQHDDLIDAAAEAAAIAKTHGFGRLFDVLAELEADRIITETVVDD